MDCYLMSRMFRSFKYKESKPYMYHGPSNNSIIFAGSRHTEEYINQLLDLGFEFKFFTYTNVTSRIVSIKNLHQPFFTETEYVDEHDKYLSKFERYMNFDMDSILNNEIFMGEDSDYESDNDHAL